MKSFIFLLLLFSLINHSNAQISFEGNKSTSDAFLRKIIPPSPNATSLGKYGDQQINLFNGTTAVNVPVYEIKLGDYSIPIGLSYSSTGLKVSEAASNVGLGWSLSGQSVITRVVRGAADFTNQDYINIGACPLPNSGYSMKADNAWNYLHNLLNSPSLDREPDLYIVTAGKLRVKFYFDQYKRIQTIPYNNGIKINFNASNNESSITDEDGTKYYFGGTTESIETTYQSGTTPSYISSWFLTKIITPVGEQITYNYSKGTNFIYQDQYSESDEAVDYNSSVGQDCSPGGPPIRTVQFSSQITLPSFLNSIETVNEIVSFVRSSTEREDLPADFTLTGIKVYSKKTGKYPYNYRFLTSYFPQVSQYCWGHPTAFPSHSHDHAAYCKRLRLDQFIEDGSDANTPGNNSKVYTFKYSTKPIPSRCSLDQDYWGYYNGAGNTSLLPHVDDLEFQYTAYTAVSREANHNYADAGMLQKIIYPTGGESDFVYAPNEVTTTVPGPSQQTVQASLSGTSTVLESSVTFNMAAAGTVLLSYTLSDVNLPNNDLKRKVELFDPSNNLIQYNFNADYSNLNVFLGSTGTYTLKVSRNFSYTNYPSVTPVGCFAQVTFPITQTFTSTTRKVGGFRIQKIYDKTGSTDVETTIKEFKYDNPYFIADIKSTDCLNNYDRWYSKSINGEDHPLSSYVNYQCRYKSRSTSAVQPIGSIQGGIIGYNKVTCNYGTNGTNGKTEYYYSVYPDETEHLPFNTYTPVVSYDHRRGNLLRQIDYNAGGNILKITSSDYDYIPKYQGDFVYPYYMLDQPIIAGTGPSLYPFKIVGFAQFRIPSEWVRKKNESVTIYSGANTITTNKEFSYDNPNQSYLTQTKITDSKGDVISQLDKYPLDYKPATVLCKEEIDRKFETDYQALYNTFVNCNESNSTQSSLNACYTNFSNAYTSLQFNRIAAINNLESTFSTAASSTSDAILKGEYQLIAKNNLSALHESKTLKNGTQEIERSTTDYKDFSGNMLPEKFNKSISGGALVNQLTIDAYTSNGKVLQATPLNGVKTSYLWGYNSQYPVARISNATSSVINPYITQSVLDNPVDDATLRSHLNPLRTISGAMVTNYTYAPLIGSTSETDPAGKTTFYEYDAFNRLKNIKDYQGNIVKNFQYNYKGNADTVHFGVTEVFKDDIRILRDSYSQVFKNGIAHIPQEITAGTPYASSNLVIQKNDTICVNNDFAIEARFKADSSLLLRYCSVINFIFWNDTGNNYVTSTFNMDGTQGRSCANASFIQNNGAQSGDTTNSAMYFRNMFNWTKVKMVFKNYQAKIYIDDVLANTLPYTYPINKIRRWAFGLGFGYADYVKVYDSAGILQYVEEFEDAAQSPSNTPAALHCTSQ